MLASLTDVSLSFPDKRVLEDVSLTIYPSDRVALVGENGSGKTSLFRILTGRLRPDAGDVSRARGAGIGYLEQDLADLPGDRTCRAAASEAFAAQISLEKRLEDLSAALSGADPERQDDLLEALGEAQERFEQSGGYEFRARVEAALDGLGLPPELRERRVAELSEGQKMRVALARLLLGEHALILLDEPTNHLDVPAREWLEEYLVATNRAYVVASHDRRFLDAVATKTAHLDHGKLTLYPGNYTEFRRQLEQAEQESWREYEKKDRLARKLQRQAQDYARWADAKEKSKRGAGDKGFVGHRSAKLMKRSLAARSRMKQAAEQARTEKPFVKDPIKIDFGAPPGRHLLSVEALAVGYEVGRPLASGLNFHLSGGDRLAVVGPNGCGKTALLRTVVGEVPALAGRVSLSPSARPGYFDQENRGVPRNLTALQTVLETGRDATLARTVMGRMGVGRETVNQPAGRLSSGERAKVLLTKLVLGDHGLLVLDEPANYLDIETQDVLLDALSGFLGGILFVSHDRYFTGALATDVLRMAE